MQFTVQDNVLTGVSFDDLSETSMVIPDGIRGIEIEPWDLGFGSWDDIPPIREIHIPGSVRFISIDSFHLVRESEGSFPQLEKVFFYGSLEQWCSIDRGRYGKHSVQFYLDDGLDRFDLYLLNQDNEFKIVRSILFDDQEQTIKDGAFFGCKSLQIVEFLHSARIGACAFASCPGLKSITVHGAKLSLWSDWEGSLDEYAFPFPDDPSFTLWLSKAAAEYGLTEDCVILQSDISVQLLGAEDLPDLKEVFETELDATTDLDQHPDEWESMSFIDRYLWLTSVAREDDYDADEFDAEDDPESEAFHLQGYEMIEIDEFGRSVDALCPDFEDLEALEDYIDSTT